MDDDEKRESSPRGDVDPSAEAVQPRPAAEPFDDEFDEHMTGALELVSPDAPAPDADTPLLSFPTPMPDPAATERTTEWFSVEDEFSMEEAPPPLPRRNHHVTAVVVSHDGAVWLPAVLTTLAAQTRPPQIAVGVDAGSADASADLLSAAFGPGATVRIEGNPGFGAAVRAGLDHVGPVQPEPYGPGSVSWVWLLHDDSAPGQHCLEALLNAADDNPSVAVLGPKILGWHDRRLLLEAGVTINGAGRRVTGLERREHDQGQHDGDRDVLAVSSAGMLIRRDVWERLGGYDPALPLFRDDLEFCWRAHRSGERVMVATEAVLHHREASAHGRRADDLAPRPHRADREAAVHVLLAQPSALVAPFVALRLILGSLGRAGLYLLGKDVLAARDEVSAVLALALHPSKVRSSRELVSQTTTEPARVVRHLRPTALDQLKHGFEVVTGVLTTSGATGPTTSVSALDSGPVGDDADYLVDDSGVLRRILTAPWFLISALLVIVAVIGTRGLWLGDGVLQGGALFPAPPGFGDLWETYRQAWHDVGSGSTTPSPPYLMAIAAVAAILLGKAPAAVSVLLLLGIPLAGISAYIALRGLVPNQGIRVWAAAAYALLPAVTGATASGRIGTTMLAIVLPLALRSVARLASERGTIRRAAGTAILMAIVISVAPIVWLIIIVAVLAMLGWRARSGVAIGSISLRLGIGLLAPLLLLLPWSVHLLTNPAMLLLEPGLNAGDITDRTLAPWHVLLLHPGGPGMTPVWITIALVLAGGLALLRTDRLAVTSVFAVLGGVALVFGLVQIVVLVTPPGSTVAIRPWPGQATLVLGLALIAMAAVAFDGLRDRFVGASFSLGQPVVFLVAIGALVVPVLTAGWYAVSASSVVVKAPTSAVPAFVAADAEGPQAPRSLILEQKAAGSVVYSLLNGPGPVLGDAETGPPADSWVLLDPAVAAMVSGRGGDEIAMLAGYGIRYVLLAPGASTELVPTLDGEPGLRRLSSSGGEVLWRVAGTTSRARMVSGDRTVPLGIDPEGTVTANPYLDETLPEQAPSGTLVTGAALDPGWRAIARSADGGTTTLNSVAGPDLTSWSQAFDVPDGAASVRVEFDSSSRSAWLWWQLVVLLALVVMALPSRRRVDPDPDLDTDRPMTEADGLLAEEVSDDVRA